VDLFERYGLDLPTTWEKLEIAVAKFHEEGIVPIAVSLSDRPHYIAEFCILAAGSPSEHLARPKTMSDLPQSWIKGMELLRTLYTMHAFPANVNATTQAASSELFSTKRAAMQVDGSWFANGLPPGNMDTTVVIPFPAYAPEADPTTSIGGVSMGFYLSRSAWNDPEKRDAAVDLLHFLSTGDNAAALGGFIFTGKLLDSSYQMVNNAKFMNAPIQDVMSPEARAAWFGSIPGIAEGTIAPARMWESVMKMNPFATE
jgi:raffinose/stachyose/melibiose transport system substrate-binding protein